MRKFALGFIAMLLVYSCDRSPGELPSIEDMAGTYYLSEESRGFLLNSKGYKSIPKSEITLGENGFVTIAGLPDCYTSSFGEGGGKYLSGRGKWELEPLSRGYGVTLTIEEGGSMKRGIYHGGSIEIIGKRAPYSLEFGIGDPDSGQSIAYERIGS